MSQRQILITRYVTHLSRATKTRYELHFLFNEKDSASRTMLIESLDSVASETNNETVRRAIGNAKQGSGDITFGQHTKNKANKISKDIQDNHRMTVGGESSKDHKQAGINQYQSLYLEDALKSFSKSFDDIRQRNGHISTADKMYGVRTEINLVLGNYAEALSLAQKGRLDDMAFIAAISNGDFDIAKQYIKANIFKIKKNAQERNLIATTYEILYLIIFVLFATSTASETKELTDELFQSTTYVLEEIKPYLNSFCQRNYKSFLERLPELRKTFQFSIYTSPVVDKLTNAIIQNVVSLHLFPLARAPINLLCSEYNLSTQDAIAFIQDSIRKGKLNGKLDFVTNTYIGSLVLDEEHNGMKKYTNQMMQIRRDFQLNLWIKEYNTTVVKK